MDDKRQVYYKVHYSNNAIVSFYQLSDKSFIRHVNYTDCEKCHGVFKHDSMASFNKCDCRYKWYSDNNPVRQLNDKRQEIKSRVKELEKSYKKIVTQEKKSIKVLHPELNNRKRQSIRTVNRMIDDKYINSDIAKEYRKLLKEYWQLSINDFPIPKVIKIDGVNLDNWHVIKKTYAGSYTSQGYGAHKYTIGTLQPYQDILNQLEIKSYIIDTGAYYELICQENISLDDLKELNNMSLSDWCQYHWNRGRNPRVYNPFLPYDKSELEFGYNKNI